MNKKLMILAVVFVILGAAYLFLFSKGSTVNWLIKNHFVGSESKKILMQLDKPFLDTWKRAASQGLQRFNYGNIIGYNTKVGQVLNVQYGKTM